MTAHPTSTDRPQAGFSFSGKIDEAMIRRVVDRFYALVREDEVLGPVFRSAIPDEKWQAHLGTIADFWSSLLLGSGRYNGRPLPKHLALPDVGDAHFRRWLALFRTTAEEVCPPAVAALMVERAERVANSFRLGISVHRGEGPAPLKPLGLED
ncbi:group III truncated hemoglobin [Roseomonas elaeocarpi]|uniref:Group III truncated hemoglobin n=1 Tax=Roseomonas elaeocarpi TaxID=907779 RepID=A0ABV6JQP1_9PROT